MRKSSWIILSAVVAVIFFALANGATLSKSNGAPDSYTACVIAEQVVTDRLKTRATAVFPQTCREPETSIVQSGDTWTVRSFVDAENLFGVMLRADTTVVIVYHPDTEKWTVKDFQMDTR